MYHAWGEFCEILIGKHEENKTTWETYDVDGKTKLKGFLKKKSVMVFAGFIWLITSRK
jgi:hypothetical protein